MSTLFLGLTPFSVTLIGAVAKSSLLLFAAWCATLLLRRKTAALRHLVWTSAIACSLALLALQFVLPAWRVLPRVQTTTDTQVALQPAPMEIRTFIADNTAVSTQQSKAVAAHLRAPRLASNAQLATPMQSSQVASHASEQVAAV